MSRKNTMGPKAIITDGDMSQASLTSDYILMEGLDNAWVQLEWSGAPVGSFYVDYSDTPEDDNKWVLGVTSLALDTSPSGIELNQVPGKVAVRIRYARTSGTGTLQARFSAKMI